MFRSYHSINKIGLLFIGGEGPNTISTKIDASNVKIKVAADSGYDIAIKLGITPDYIIGDMDSISDKSKLDTFAKEKIQKYPHDKDETDTEIGLKLLSVLETDYKIMVGGGGGRLDHILAIFALFSRKMKPNEWITKNEHIYYIKDNNTFTGLKGKIVSLFPLGNEPCSMKSSGLKWEIDGQVWVHGCYGISNEVNKEKLYLNTINGSYLLIINNNL